MSDDQNDRWQVAEAALAEALRSGEVRTAKRERVEIGAGRGPRRAVRTLDEMEELTGAGEALLSELMRTQLILAMKLIVLTAVVLGAIPLAFLFVPSLGTISIFGLRLPWLLLGFAVYPFFIAVAWSYNRSIDRNEQEFTEMVEN